ESVTFPHQKSIDALGSQGWVSSSENSDRRLLVADDDFVVSSLLQPAVSAARGSALAEAPGPRGRPPSACRPGRGALSPREGRGPYEWVLWLDCGAVVAEPSLSVPSLLAPHGGRAGVATSLVISAGHWGLRPEAWLLRGSPWGRAFLRRWAAGLPGARPAAPLSERVALQHAVLPHWEAWASQEGSTVDWQGLRWPPEVQLSRALLATDAMDREDLGGGTLAVLDGGP
ncbi:unnamed protein product, partial [Prorocentrum cordatum]